MNFEIRDKELWIGGFYVGKLNNINEDILIIVKRAFELGCIYMKYNLTTSIHKIDSTFTNNWENVNGSTATLEQDESVYRKSTKINENS
jgi:hypothetical protein